MLFFNANKKLLRVLLVLIAMQQLSAVQANSSNAPISGRQILSVPGPCGQFCGHACSILVTWAHSRLVLIWDGGVRVGTSSKK
jgi:hypothetical protein